MSHHMPPISGFFHKDGGMRLLPTPTGSDREKGIPFGSQKHVLSEHSIKNREHTDEVERKEGTVRFSPPYSPHLSNPCRPSETHK